MPVKIVYPFDPDHLDAEQPPFVEDLVELLGQGHQTALDEIVKMVADLKQQGVTVAISKSSRAIHCGNLKAGQEVVKKAARECICLLGQTTRFSYATPNIKLKVRRLNCFSKTLPILLLLFKRVRKYYPAKKGTL
jgi:hypothetical protein